MRAFFKENIEPLNDALDHFPWAQKRAYGCLLAQTYYYVTHATRLLAVAASRFGIEDEALHRRFAVHMAEEKGHHILASHDLGALGFRLADFAELPPTKAFYEAQYYKCNYLDPAALFGYILALEGIATTRGKKLYETVVAAHGKNAATFLKVHADDDIDHIEKAFQAVEEMSATRRKLIEDNFLQSSYIYRHMLRECSKA
jgi:hypothetical protein